MKHAQEPWKIYRNLKGWGNHSVVKATDGEVIHSQHMAIALENIERYVECVNACANIQAPESVIPGCVKFVTTTDYKMLAEQKQSLLIAIEQAIEEGVANDLTGILHLIDSLQETAVKIGFPETTVFPKNEDDEE